MLSFAWLGGEKRKPAIANNFRGHALQDFVREVLKYLMVRMAVDVDEPGGDDQT
jgi:hypothetical protein